MQFVPGTVRLSDIVNGTLGAGSVPWQRRNGVITKSQSGPHTITATPTVIDTEDLGTLIEDDVVFFQVAAQIIKGATSGVTHMEVIKNSGVGVVQWLGMNNQGNESQSTHYQNSDWFCQLLAIGIVTSGGTYVAGIRGTSNGSNATINVNELRRQWWVSKGPVV